MFWYLPLFAINLYNVDMTNNGFRLQREHCVPNGEKEDPEIDNMRNEHEITFAIEHRNIVKAAEFISREYHKAYRCYYLNMEVMAVSPLLIAKYLSGITDIKYFLSILKQVALDLLNAVEYLHGKGLYHRNINPNYIIVDIQESAPKFRLVGLGGATRVPESHEIQSEEYYYPPEIDCYIYYSHCPSFENSLVDIYNIGATLSTLYIKKFGNLDLRHLTTQSRKELLQFFNFLDYLEKSAENRPTATMALLHPFLHRQ
eukprot:NODE_311_length_10039_cov_0.864487.p6 type:complete len:258 gc:universal NODE_311_length_10039_cov_0.864487:9863-9090(-)